MNTPDHHHDSTDWNLQAGEYVLGTLGVHERREFESRLRDSAPLQTQVANWEERLAALADSIPAETPPAYIKREIMASLPRAARPVRAFDDTPPEAPHNRATSGGDYLWKGVASLAMAACLVMAVVIWDQARRLQTIDGEALRAVGLFVDQQQTLWLIEASLASQQLQVTALNPPDLPSGKAYELWLVKPDDQGVVSLGLLSLDIDQTVRTTAPQLQDNAVAFAISLEPAGGSPQAAPTGPVVYQAPFRVLSESL